MQGTRSDLSERDQLTVGIERRKVRAGIARPPVCLPSVDRRSSRPPDAGAKVRCRTDSQRRRCICESSGAVLSSDVNQQMSIGDPEPNTVTFQMSGFSTQVLRGGPQCRSLGSDPAGKRITVPGLVIGNSRRGARSFSGAQLMPGQSNDPAPQCARRSKHLSRFRPKRLPWQRLSLA